MKKFTAVVVLALVTGVASLGAFTGYRFYTYTTTVEEAEKLYADSEENDYVVEYTDFVTTRNDVSGVAKNAMPAMVSVNTVSVVEYRDFFGLSRSREVSGAGTGIIAAQDDGNIFIITNYHVVEGANSITVEFTDGFSVKAEVKATEESEDLAVLSVFASQIPSDTRHKIRMAVFADSDNLVAGEMVIAIGNAEGHGQSATVGYVSAVNRTVTIDNYSMNLIQTDVAINPGNSGGALLDLQGRVVGINNAKIASDSVEGICYAIPSSHAIPIVVELLSRNVLAKDERAILEVKGMFLSAQFTQAFNLPKGYYIQEVTAGSCAEEAGLVAGHIITKINGKSIINEESFEKILSYIKRGSTGEITVLEKQHGTYVERTLEITFGSLK